MRIPLQILASALSIALWISFVYIGLTGLSLILDGDESGWFLFLAVAALAAIKSQQD